MGTGTLTIAVGTSSFSVAIDADHKTLAQVRDAINQAAGNTDIVRATIVNAADAHPGVSACSAGTANKIVVSQADGDGGLASLAYNPALTTNYKVHRAGCGGVHRWLRTSQHLEHVFRRHRWREYHGAQGRRG